ncbi:5'-nucleotidase [Aquimarina addita]
MYKSFVLLVFLILLSSCKKKNHLLKAESTRIEINDQALSNIAIDSFIKPYRQNVKKNLDSVLAYSPEAHTKGDGVLNTAIGNLMADIVLKQANLVFESRTEKTIHMTLLNYGGIRAPIPKGDITARTAYEVMPFENSIVVVEMKGIDIKKLIKYLQNSKRAHPIAGLKLAVDANFNLVKALIKDKEIKDDEIYFVATNDYLYYGGDEMYFFKQGIKSYALNYKIRNAMIDYFKKVDTIIAKKDDRFIQIN